MLLSDLPRRVAAELVGSALLGLVVVGSGAAAQQLVPAQVGLELAINALATAAGLYAIIAVLGPVSGAHLNPVVSVALCARGEARWRDLPAYAAAQVAGFVGGSLVANAMFAVPAGLSHHDRVTSARLLGEVVATFGLVLVIVTLVRRREAARVAPVVGAYIGAAYLFTSSTSFANPAITVGRMFTTSFAGIAPGSVLPFIGAQVVGGALGLAAAAWFEPREVAA